MRGVRRGEESGGILFPPWPYHEVYFETSHPLHLAPDINLFCQYYGLLQIASLLA